uniref:Reverse transcriptase domain-containing protein n=1 Tax=Micrurus lemniscatus lemniscatus TaxID=129467 RepID=A0A2D4HF38_MICLE
MIDLYNEALQMCQNTEDVDRGIHNAYTQGTDRPAANKELQADLAPNVDYKILATIISERLKKILSKIIHSDQNGFLPNRQMKTNTRLIMDVLECYEMHPSKPMVLMFLDAQNAFDNLNWNQLTNMKFGENGTY